MLEIPEAHTIAGQITSALQGKKIKSVSAGSSPHKFAWYYGDPAEYNHRLAGSTIGSARSWGGLVEIDAGGSNLLFGDGVALRVHAEGEKRPSRHQMLVEFEDGSALSGSVQMYGGLWCFPQGSFDYPYYQVARERPSPLSDSFSRDHFNCLLDEAPRQRLRVKALLATEQRIPGLGNGVLQDILYEARIHPKRQVDSLSAQEQENLYHAIRTVLAQMTQEGGRDTERDLYANPGNYRTRLSKNTVGTPCPTCGTTITKESFMGGSIYFCGRCQPL